MNIGNKEKLGILENTLALMKKFDEFGHQALSIGEVYQLIMGLFEIVLSKEDETRQSKERAIKMLANSLGYGVAFTDLSAAAAIRKTKVAPKYRNPQNHNETWTGRGCKPVWVQNHLDLGGKKEELKIIN